MGAACGHAVREDVREAFEAELPNPMDAVRVHAVKLAGVLGEVREDVREAFEAELPGPMDAARVHAVKLVGLLDEVSEDVREAFEEAELPAVKAAVYDHAVKLAGVLGEVREDAREAFWTELPAASGATGTVDTWCQLVEVGLLHVLLTGTMPVLPPALLGVVGIWMCPLTIALSFQNGVPWPCIRYWSYMATADVLLHSGWGHRYLFSLVDHGAVLLAAFAFCQSVLSVASRKTFWKERPLEAYLAVSGSVYIILSTARVVAFDPARPLASLSHFLFYP